MKRIRLLLLSTLVSLLSVALIGQSTISITTSGGLYATEKWVSITTMANGAGTVAWAQGNGTYGDGQGLLTNEMVSLAPGTYYVNCYDKYADAWDGTLISITAYGSVIGNNGGVTPDDGTDTDASGSWEPPGTTELEASFAIVVPAAPSCLPPTTLTATSTSTGASLGWTAGGTETTWDIEWGASGFSQYSGTPVNTMTNPHSLNGLTANTTYDFYVRAACSASDTSAWAGPYSFTTLCASETLPWTENFESMTSTGSGVIPDCMVETGDWATSGTTGNNNRGPNSGSNYIYTNWTADDWLFTPSFDLVMGTSYDFSFYYKTDGLSGWTTLETKMGAGQTSSDMTIAIGTAVSGATNTGYTKYTATFTPTTTGTYNMGIHVVATSSPWYINFDDLRMEATPTCPSPLSLTTANLTSTSVDLGWTEAGTAAKWDIEYGASGYTQGTGTLVSGVTANPHSLSSLMANTSYDWYVRADCGAGDTSAWTGPSSFYTGYCQVSSTNSGSYFDDFTTTGGSTNISNTGSGYAAGGYLDSTASSVSQYTGASINFTTTLVGTTVGVNVWVDWNNDLDFDDAGEKVYTSGGYVSSASGTITVPAGTAIGAYRMRATCDYNSSDPDACSPGTRSETEDYTFNVVAPPACVPPTAGVVTNLQADSATLGWTENGTATMWNIEYDTAGFMLGNGTMTTVNGNPYQISGLMADTDYEFYVQANCGANTSSWAGPYSFTTACAALTAATLPFKEDFENDDVTLQGSGNVICSTNHKWTFETDHPDGRVRTGADSYVPGTATLDVDPSGTLTKNYLTLTLDLSNYTASTDLELFFDFADVGDEPHATDSVWIRGNDSDTWVGIYDWSTTNSTSFTTAGYFDIDALLTAAGQTVSSSFQVRFGQEDNFPTNSDGLVLDNVIVKERIDNDVAISNGIITSTASCQTAQQITVDITNTGKLTQTSIPVAYTVNGGTPVTATWTGTLAADSTKTYTFATTYDGSASGDYDIVAYTALATDGDNSNDTLAGTVTTAPIYTVPFAENFEAGTSLPADWSYNGSIGNNVHNSQSRVIYRNMYSTGTSNFTTDLPKVGSIVTGNVLKFDYRYTNYSAGTVGTALEDDSLRVQISTDCGATFTTIAVIDSSNHVTSANYATMQYDLSNYAGQTIVVRMAATWQGTSDYYLDLDNFFIGTPLAGNSMVTAPIACSGDMNGTAMAVGTGGLSPYTYQWDANAGGSTTDTTTSLGAGTYYVTITDAAGDSTLDSVTIMDPAMTLTTAISNTGCFLGTDGAIDLTVTGGAGGYGYVWDNLITVQDQSGLVAGSYMVTVTDANGCTATDTYTITQPSGYSSSISSTNVTCNGSATGSIDLTISGATAPYSYMWSNGDTTQDLTNIMAGAYTVTVTDANNCEGIFNQTITEGAAIVSMPTITDATCNSGNGGNDGAISLAVTGGDGTYTYMWSNNNTTANLTGLTGGTYTVTITDGSNCTKVETYTVAEPTFLLSIINVDQAIACNGDTGSLAPVVGGGTAPYTFAWADGAGNAITSLSGLSADVYSATVTDANGCMTTTSVNLTEPALIAGNAVITDALCNGDNGSVMLNANGGTGAYNFAWSAAGVGNMSSATLAAGSYTVTITDANNCSVTETATINQPDALALTASATSDSAAVGQGTASVSAMGGTAPYTYQWDAAAGDATTATATGLVFGTYSVTVTDANGCQEITTASVEDVTGTNAVDYISNLDIFPNPTRGFATIQLELSRTADVNVQIYNLAGQVVADLGNRTTTNQEYKVDLSKYAAGMYFVRFIIDGNVITRKLTLTK